MHNFLYLIGYYFAPMILIGCLSILSGVVVAALYHQHGSHPIPNWLRILTRVPLSKEPVSPSPKPELEMKLIDETSDNKTSDKRVYNDLHNSPTENGMQVFNGHGGIEHPTVRKAKVTQQEESHLRKNDYTADWRLVATTIDRLMLVVGVVVTISAVVVTAVLI